VIHVRVDHPEGKRWGFQLTARLGSNETKTAGSFTPAASINVRCDDGAASSDGNVRGSQGPCAADQLQFASHNGTSTQQNAGFGAWDIEWTPPDSDVGEIVFYAAGNAADNSGNNRGDRIYTSSQRITTCTLGGKPTVSSVVNAGSYADGGAPNAMISIFGANFLNLTQQKTAGLNDFDDLKYPSELGCIAVEINGVRAPLSFANQLQINAQVPVNIVGNVQVRVISNVGRPNEIRGDPATATLTKYSPAFFTFGSSKSIAAVTVENGAAVYVTTPNNAPQARPAKPSETISLFGTGFGPTSGGYPAGILTPDLSRLTDPFTITIGNTILAASDISFAGLAPGAITGLYQFNVKIPASLPDGEAAVTIDIGGSKTQSGAFVPIKQ
jgi:uncharacterized protein (TIGR03437 family)